MFILPLRTDRPLAHTPWVTYALIAANILCHLWLGLNPDDNERLIRQLMLWPTDPQFHQFITYQFLHGGWMHLLGNMLFLYVFGQNVEDRLGKVGYLSFYLAGGVIAGLGFSILERNPVLGASGSVAAVTGAYLALFPRSHITLLYFFFLIGTFEVTGLVLILFQISQDVFFFMLDRGGVAYLAHICGYLFGFGVGMGLLWSRLLAREPYDMLSLWAQRRRRSQFRSLTRQGYHPWEAGHAGQQEASRTSEEDQAIMTHRSLISQAAATHDLDLATQTYLQLLQLDGDQVMPPRLQLDIANHLASQGRHDQAARAYELYLNTFRRGEPDRPQVELMLGLIYARYLGRLQRARELLTSAAGKLIDPALRSLAQDTLNQINTPGSNPRK